MAPTSRSVVLAAALLAATAIPGTGQQSPAARPAEPPRDQAQGADQQPPTFRGGINFVRVDVIVSQKNGAPVLDLRAEDFEVTEDGRRQTIETFKLIEFNTGLLPGPDGPPRAIRSDSDEETEAGRDDVRLFGIFLDDYHVRRETGLRAREDLARFVETQLGPADMVAVMYPLQSLDSVRFTRDHGAVRRALQSFEGRKYDYEPRNSFEQVYSNYPTETVERIRNQVSLSALEGLVIRMGSLKEGRKALILLSEGYTNMVPPQLRSSIAGVRDPSNPASRDPLAGANDPNEERAAFFANADLDLELRDLYAAANRNNVAIYAVDPRGLAQEFGIDQNIGYTIDRSYLNATQETLRTLSRETEGREIVSRNDLLGGMRQIVQDSSAYYLVGYSSTLAPSDGKFHEIKVRVRRPGVQVRARKGYWAVTAADAARALAPPKPAPPKAVTAALVAISQPARSRVIRTWIGTERGENGKTRVTFLWEPVKPTAGARDRAQPSRVSLVAAGSAGTPFFRGRVAAPSASSPAAGPGGPARVTFDADPGVMQLRVSVEDAGADVLDAETTEVTVPDLTRSRVALATPMVFSARTVRQLQQLKSDPQAMPALSREFSRTERLLVRLMAYAGGDTPPALTAKLLNRAGQPITEVPVTPANGQAPASVELALGSLAPGDYLLEVSARAGDDSATELVGFRVTS
jgi:VWFA-related protein